MLEPPFIEFAYYVGTENVPKSLAALGYGSAHEGSELQEAPSIIGLGTGVEQIGAQDGVVLLRAEGADFCGSLRRSSSRLRKQGLKVYGAFIDVAAKIEFVYGAILVEYSLEDPNELRRDPRSLAFRNFVLRKSRVGEATVGEIVRVAGAEAFVQEVVDGTYVSMSPEFNPEGRGIDSLDAQERSVQIATLLARRL